MLIRLNKRNHRRVKYKPPFEVIRCFDDVDRDAPGEEQIEALLWIPWMLVCRFIAQFPTLRSEADALFSEGYMVVVDKVMNTKYPSEKIGAVINVAACKAMEDYANRLNSVVYVSHDTQYNNLKKGKQTPHHVKLVSDLTTEDDHAELLVRDAAELLGVDVDNMTLKEKRRIQEVLER